MKKAQLSLQFNWIFILVVGAIIMIFFLMVIKNQTKDANYELAGDIIKNLDTVIKSSEQSVGTFKMIDIPPSTIEFVCDPGISMYNLGEGISKNIPYDIIFAQEELTGNQLLSWTRSWNVPFRIATFQYLTTKNAQFIIINDSGTLSEELYDLLPGNLSKIMIERNEVYTDNEHNYYKIIQFYGNEQTVNNNIASTNVHKITIRVESGDLNSWGTITFNDDFRTHNFLKIESLYGAIFANDADFYECTMNKALSRLDTLMYLAEERTSELEDSATNNKCETLYTWAIEDIQNIRPLPNQNIPLSSAESIYQHSKSIERGNNNLMTGRDCALIY